MAVFNEKTREKLNNLPAAKRERAFYYIVFAVLGSVILSLCYLIKVKDAKIDTLQEEKVTMERNFRDEVDRKVTTAVKEAKIDILQQVMPVVEGREQRGAMVESQYNQIIPEQLESRKAQIEAKNKHLQLIKELNKHQKP